MIFPQSVIRVPYCATRQVRPTVESSAGATDYGGCWQPKGITIRAARQRPVLMSIPSPLDTSPVCALDQWHNTHLRSVLPYPSILVQRPPTWLENSRRFSEYPLRSPALERRRRIVVDIWAVAPCSTSTPLRCSSEPVPPSSRRRSPFPSRSIIPLPSAD